MTAKPAPIASAGLYGASVYVEGNGSSTALTDIATPPFTGAYPGPSWFAVIQK